MGRENLRIGLVLIVLIAASLVICGCASKSKSASASTNTNAKVNNTTNTNSLPKCPALQNLSFNSTVANLLPNKIMGMEKLVALKGETAIEFIKQSHRGPIRFVKDAALIHYIPNSTHLSESSKMMVLWITEYPSAKLAQNQTLAMVKGMKKFGGVWVQVKKAKLGNISVYYVPAKNQYFFYEGKYVIYLMPKNMNNTSITKFAEIVYGTLKSEIKS